MNRENSAAHQGPSLPGTTLPWSVFSAWDPNHRALQLPDQGPSGSWILLLFGRELILLTPPDEEIKARRFLEAMDLHQRQLMPTAPGEILVIAQYDRGFQTAFPAVPVLLDHRDFLLVGAGGEKQEILETQILKGFVASEIRGTQEIYSTAPLSGPGAPELRWVRKLVEAISESEIRKHFYSIVSERSRFSTTPEFQTIATRCMKTFKGWGYSARLEKIEIAGQASYNVIADKPGEGAGRGVFLVVAHLDSKSEKPLTNAPGYDDNASGCAALLHMAQLLQGHSSHHDLRFILFGGEEQILKGSTQYVDGLKKVPQELHRIRGVLNMDMIGCDNGIKPLGVRLLGSKNLRDQLRAANRTYGTGLEVSSGGISPLSDHLPFQDENIPAVLTKEPGINVHRHKTSDLKADFGLIARVLRMNLAATALEIGRASSP